MVLGARVGDVATRRVPSHPSAGGDPACIAAGERGSQALEFAMVLPLIGILIAVLVHTGLLLGDVVLAQGIAREVARTAAVESAAAAKEVGQQLAGRREVRIALAARDGLVDARIELHSTVFAGAGVDIWVPGRAAMRPEGPLEDAVDG